MEQPDVLVLGTGIAGLLTALGAAEYGTVLVLTKKEAQDSNTNWAQGGIAAVFGSTDSFAAHVRDTLRVGAGLCDAKTVRRVVEDGPERVRELEALGVGFSRNRGGYELGREGGHGKRRIVHASDFTGRAVERTLLGRVRAHPNITVMEHQLAVDLIIDSRLRGRRKGHGRDVCWGAYVMDTRTRRIRPVSARATVLATGGAGKVYLYTTNPDIATGDGVAMAYRAGVPITNLEFVQFHPTCLYDSRAKSFLLSEAMRGEGAVLRTLDGRPLMKGVHRDGDLAPRDVVARAIDREMKRRGDPHVFLDISARPARRVRERFPNIHARLLSLGIDMTRQPIPVVPAAHYMCGGVKASLSGRTTLDGLLAIGEVACTGLHGANRLASNSLLEALVSAHHATREVARRLETVRKVPRPQPWSSRGTHPPQESVVFNHNWDTVRRVMWDLVGIVRTDERLAFAARRLALLAEDIAYDFGRLRLSPDLIELRNITLVGALIVRAATMRKESRGLHFNLDHPRPSAPWRSRTTTARRRGPTTTPRRLAASALVDL